jgi:hypothetical protein
MVFGHVVTYVVTLETNKDPPGLDLQNPGLGGCGEKMLPCVVA